MRPHIRIERADTGVPRLVKSDRIIAVTENGELDISNMVRSWEVRAEMAHREILTLEFLAVDIVDSPDLALLRSAAT